MMRRRLLLCGLPLLLSGCGSILPKPAPAPPLYRLTALPAAAPPAGPPIDAQLMVDPPVAPAELDSARIALDRGADRFDYFANAAWTDRVPGMVETLLIESLENAARIRVVGSQAADFRPDATLSTSIRRFQAVYAGEAPPTVEVWLDCRLTRSSDFSVLAVRSFRGSSVASANDMAAIVAAFDAALHQALAELPAWVATALAGKTS
jgi:cholesterol transport system auxiliary component